MDLEQAFFSVLRDVALFSEHLGGLRLRRYQQAAARAIVDSVMRRKGLTFVVIFPRQSGKNELQAQIETYLLTLLQNQPAELVKVSPTWKPQSLNAMRRLERALKKNLVTRGRWLKEQGFIYRLGEARVFFLSGAPGASIVGATASTLLECDEAQDVSIEKWDRDIAPMAASTNATRVFWGTAWTSTTLLAREKRAALQAQQRDGVQRLFELTADEVRQEVAAYGRYVDAEIEKMGRNNPYIRTQYFSQEIDDQAGMFGSGRLALMYGTHAAQITPRAGAVYVFCVDVGGEALTQTLPREAEEAPTLPLPREAEEPPALTLPREGGEAPTLTLPREGEARVGDHDATVLTVFEVDFSTLADEGLRAPTFRAVHRRRWIGAGQPQLYAELNALIGLWSPHRTVIDATGLGEGLAAFLDRSHPGQILRFKFSQASKSDLGWKFLSIVESGRYKEHAAGDDFSEPHRLQDVFFLQARFCEMHILPGPGRLLRFGVREGFRAPGRREPLHDDLLLSAMLVGALFDERWGDARSVVIAPQDPLEGLGF